MRPGTFNVSRAIARVTFSEVVRDKILYNIIVCAVLLFSMGFLASRLTFVRPERVLLDFGMSAVNLSCAMIAAFTGASLIGREFERRTIYVALSHPISRAQFVLGKFFGIASVIVVNWALLSVAHLLLLWSSGADLRMVVSFALFYGLFLLLLQSLAIASLAILFSTFSTTSLSAIMTLGFYLVGNNISEIQVVASRLNSSVGKAALRALAAILPNFEHFNLGYRVTYGLPVDLTWGVFGAAYALAIIAFFLALASFLIRGREI